MSQQCFPPHVSKPCILCCARFLECDMPCFSPSKVAASPWIPENISCIFQQHHMIVLPDKDCPACDSDGTQSMHAMLQGFCMKRKVLRGCWMLLARDLLALSCRLRTAIMLDYAFEAPQVLRQLLQLLPPDLAAMTGGKSAHPTGISLSAAIQFPCNCATEV